MCWRFKCRLALKRSGIQLALMCTFFALYLVLKLYRTHINLWLRYKISYLSKSSRILDSTTRYYDSTLSKENRSDSKSRLWLPWPRRRAAGALPQLLLSPCWIKKEETSPGCTCAERGGAVSSALGRIFRDSNRREYDYINRVLVTLPLSDLQGYEDALPLSHC